MLAQAAVHTVGVNWESVFAICGILSCVFGILAAYISARVTGAIDKLRIEVISKMETRLSLLEMAVFGKNFMHNRSEGETPP
jgi:hypothetical protein